MGNLCGKQSKDNFDGQGRTLGSAPAPATKASVPSNVAAAKPKVGGPARTLGEGNSVNDPKAAAAAAAEARANKTTSGDLQKKLDAQKRQTQSQTLQQAADENRLAREADQANETRNYN
ncbi:Nn.00g016610.m01.CDS01 [Neocucurbitaria sp. VM-36]